MAQKNCKKRSESQSSVNCATLNSSNKGHECWMKFQNFDMTALGEKIFVVRWFGEFSTRSFPDEKNSFFWGWAFLMVTWCYLITRSFSPNKILIYFLRLEKLFYKVASRLTECLAFTLVLSEWNTLCSQMMSPKYKKTLLYAWQKSGSETHEEVSEFENVLLINFHTGFDCCS